MKHFIRVCTFCYDETIFSGTELYLHLIILTCEPFDMYSEPTKTHFVKRDGIIQKYTKGYSGTDYSTWQLAKSVHTGSLKLSNCPPWEVT